MTLLAGSLIQIMIRNAFACVTHISLVAMKTQKHCLNCILKNYNHLLFRLLDELPLD